MRHDSIVRIFKVQRIDSYNKTTSPSAKWSSEIWQISNFQAAKFNRNYRWLNMPTVDSTHGLFSWRSLAICIGLTSQEDNVCCSKKQCSPLGKKYLALLKSKTSCQMLVSERNQKIKPHNISMYPDLGKKSANCKKNSYSKCFLHQYACFPASCLYSFLRTRKLLMLCKDSFCNLKSFWNIWLFPKIGVPLNQSKSSILISFSIILTIHFAVPLFSETPIFCFHPSQAWFVPLPLRKEPWSGHRWNPMPMAAYSGNLPERVSIGILTANLMTSATSEGLKFIKNAPYLRHRSHGDRFTGCGLPVGFFWSNKKPTGQNTTVRSPPRPRSVHRSVATQIGASNGNLPGPRKHPVIHVASPKCRS